MDCAIVLTSSDRVLAGHLFLLHAGDCQPDTLQHPCAAQQLLRLTVCAIGTSFPNAVASVLMAQQNKPAAAIANALGSNVQNVFLAMALPWATWISAEHDHAFYGLGVLNIDEVIYQLQHDGKPINQNVAGINEGVVWMCGTLILVIFFVLMPPFCKLSYAYGPILVSVYLAYLGGDEWSWGTWKPLILPWTRLRQLLKRAKKTTRGSWILF
eukprot:s251_g3.t1